MSLDDFVFVDEMDEVENEKTQEEKFERVIKFLKKIGYFELIKDERKYNEFLQKLDYDQFKRLIFSFNALLRNIRVHEKGESNVTVRVGDIRGVRPGIRDELLHNLFDSIKKIDNNHDRAMLMYYQLLRMHIFSDGNGRTSRFLYELLNCQDDFNSVKKYFIHTSDSQNSTTSYNKFNESFDAVNNFMNEHYVSDKLSDSNIYIINKYVNELPDCMKNKVVTALKLDDELSKNSNPGKVYSLISNYLSEEEKKVFLDYLGDTGLGMFTMPGTMLTIVNLKKGNIDYIINSDKERFSTSSAFVFNIYDPNTFYNWNRDDFLLAIKIADEAKKYNINLLNDIFVNKNEYYGLSMKDIFLDTKKDLKEMIDEDDKKPTSTFSNVQHHNKN